MNKIRLNSPFFETDIARLRAGDRVLLFGVIFAARDAAHHRFGEALMQGEALPIELRGATIYYMGPSPTPPGTIIGACGPTTSSRMDRYTPMLLDCGLRAMIGKGERSTQAKKAIMEHKAVYFVTLGGAGALLSRRVKKCEVAAYSELGAEAVLKLEVDGFPAIVAIDCHGNDIFETGRTAYRRN